MSQETLMGRRSGRNKGGGVEESSRTLSISTEGVGDEQVRVLGSGITRGQSGFRSVKRYGPELKEKTFH